MQRRRQSKQPTTIDKLAGDDLSLILAELGYPPDKGGIDRVLRLKTECPELFYPLVRRIRRDLKHRRSKNQRHRYKNI